MCLILFSYKTHDKYKLILASNRDEFYSRPTLPMQWWKDHKGILAGIDEDKHGTWLGINKNGRFAALTNYRKMPIAESFNSTRGALVSEYLSTDMSSEDYSTQLRNSSEQYDGYNLLFGDIDALHYFSNRGGSKKTLEPGVYGLSNHLLDTAWPKVTNGKKKLKQLTEKEEINTNSLFEMMMNNELSADTDLPDTGVGLELERMLSASFIESPKYGTRCTTVLLVDYQNNVTIEEHSYVPKAHNIFEFTIG